MLQSNVSQGQGGRCSSWLCGAQAHLAVTVAQHDQGASAAVQREVNDALRSGRLALRAPWLSWRACAATGQALQEVCKAAGKGWAGTSTPRT